MTHDFAKIRPEPVVEQKPAEAPPAWTLLFTGLVTGLAIGVFACFLLYLSGHVPPLTVTVIAEPAETHAEVLEPDAEVTSDVVANEAFQLEFYNELPNYVVPVDPGAVQQGATVARSIAEREGARYMLQTGVFESPANAATRKSLLESLQLQAVVSQRVSAGRTLYLVQSGPFTGQEQLEQAERVLRSNSISSIRLSLNATESANETAENLN
ncbi:MAG: SPOR domain-containing protein [Pseudohongiellaceae bacterium]